jgi:phospho-N-acetylmuramoyl-pentapeptide-transferase
VSPSPTSEIIKILTYTVVAFLIALWWTPSLIRLLRWLRFWKKENRKINMTGGDFADQTLRKFYEHDESKMKVPRGGGVVIWVNTLLMAIFFWLLLKIEPTNKLLQYLNFVDRAQTFIPLGTLFFGAIFGFVDDALSTLESGGNYKAGGLKLSHRLGLISLLSFVIGCWFYFKAKIFTISIFTYQIRLDNLFDTGLNVSWLIIPITVGILLLLWGSSVIDGFDGLSGSVFVPIFICFSGIAAIRGFYDIATLMGVIAGSIMAFLWFNIAPAKFYMGDTGSCALLLTLGAVAIIIDAVYLLPITGIMLFLTVFSNIIQIFSKKVFKRKVFLAAPIHHHFEGLGLKKDQIVLRYSLITIAMSALSIALVMMR